MKLSLITPTYNSAKTLSRTIESILLQNYPDIEYIIVDGASTDNTKDIVEFYSKKIPITFISEPDKGIYDAMNKGIKRATGDIIGILNSDDFLDNDSVVSDIMNTFIDKKIDAVYGDISYFNTDIKKITRHWKTSLYSESKLNSGWTIPHPALFVKKSVYDMYGLFKEEYKIAADYEFILRILKIHKISTYYIPKVFVRMYSGGSSGKNIEQRKIGWQELKKAWQDNNLSFPRFFILKRILYKIHQLLSRG